MPDDYNKKPSQSTQTGQTGTNQPGQTQPGQAPGQRGADVGQSTGQAGQPGQMGKTGQTPTGQSTGKNQNDQAWQDANKQGAAPKGQGSATDQPKTGDKC